VPPEVEAATDEVEKVSLSTEADEEQEKQEEPALEMIFASDLVVGITSMILLEAVILGRKTMSIIPREVERAWLPTIEFGLTPAFSRREDIINNLPKILEESETYCSPDLDPFFFFGAAKRVCDFLMRQIKP